MQPIALSTDYIFRVRGSNNTPVPQDEMSMMFPVRRNAITSVDSPTTKSPGYVIELDPEEDPEENKDDETEDGPVDYSYEGEMMEMMMTVIHLGMTLMVRMRMMRTRRGRGGGALSSGQNCYLLYLLMVLVSYLMV
ncbi:hypothetical protein Tco_1006320 [Tanacetum coccineum]|uniref:Fibronectin type-III domain-containing protein n=1 Tax=Tanacetum coccineum TaxID=301880 RepID=A0ABQ5FJA3_9ASTR